MKNRIFLIAVACYFVSMCNLSAINKKIKKPNVIILYFDDMGYGDMGSNVATNVKIPKDSKYLDPTKHTLTPNLDKFNLQSLRFTNGHASDGVCSPSRYSIVTGRYSWRTRLKKGVNWGYSPSFMDKDRFTIATMFHNLGYHTAMVGKWHIGMTFYDFNGKPALVKKKSNVLKDRLVDFSRSLDNTPADHGFDYYFGTAASLDMPPYAWLESNLKTGKVNVLYKGALVSGDNVDFTQARIAENKDFITIDSRYWKKDHFRAGTKDPTFKLSDYLQVQAQKVKDLISEYKKDDAPFMFYIPMPAPHDPHLVQSKFKGSAGFKYGDYIVQSDYYAGQIIKSLGDPKDKNSLAANTVVFITSDNGPEAHSFSEGLIAGHDANGKFAGLKRDSYEGGTCVPFMIRWPGVIKPGTTDYACWQGDFLATMADYLGYKLSNKEAEDAESFLPLLENKPMSKNRRAGFMEHSMAGQLAFVSSDGKWKLIDGTGGGGFRTTSDADNNMILPTGDIGGTPRQLFNLKKDPGERDNLLVDDPKNPNDNNDPTPQALAKEKELYKFLDKIRGDD